MDPSGTVQVYVAGERWRAVRSLAACGPDDRCFALGVNDAGEATLTFGDGSTGSRPPEGAEVETTYRAGGGESGNVGRRSKSSLATLVEVIAEMIDLIHRQQEQIAAEAFIETAHERSTVLDLTELPHAIAGHRGNVRVCLCLRARRRSRIRKLPRGALSDASTPVR
jgi:hypothetical protein